MLQKKELRENAINGRNNLSTALWKRDSSQILEEILNSCYYSQAQSLFVFVSFGKEVDTHPLIKESLARGKKVYIPFVKKGDLSLKMLEIYTFDELEPGHMGILSLPQDLVEDRIRNQVDLVLVPGLLFDDQGYRLGYGGGCYDEFLAKKTHKMALGLGFSFQRVAQVPREDHDIPLSALVTEKGLEFFGD
ncbi:MAG: 5-formyltetrahydrofolate cyclo-ligase [Tissierellia bacterium]|nr:5-formyltetrahydrofolate cyclo-ligase [Tissierellia bacterium]